MKRRYFLKILGAVPVVAAVPALARTTSNNPVDVIQNILEQKYDKSEIDYDSLETARVYLNQPIGVGDVISFGSDAKTYKVTSCVVSNNGIRADLLQYDPDIYNF